MSSIRAATVLDADRILAIYAPFCADDSVVSFELFAPSLEEMQTRITSTLTSLPWLVYEDGGVVLGYAYASQFHVRAAYAWDVLVSVYLAPECRGKGIGKQLYFELFSILRELGYFNAYASISVPNPASIALHKSLGFTEFGTIPKAGYKSGTWIDVAQLWLALQEHIIDPPAPRSFRESLD